MSQDDPFTNLLEGSLAVPDFDLGAELRGRLLASAEDASSPKVVALVTEESWEVSAFNWLLGEQAADAALMDRLVLNPVFAAGLLGQQSFLRRLKLALRQPAVALVPVGKSPVRWMRSMVVASVGLAAVIAWLLVVMVPTGSMGGSSGESAAVMPVEAQQASDSRAAAIAPRERAAHARSVEGFAETAYHNENATGVGRRNVDRVRSGEALLGFSEAAQLAAREIFHGVDDAFGGEPIRLEPGMEALLASNVANSVAISSSTEGADWMFSRSLFSSGQGLFPNQNVAMIPEPSGILLTAFGTLILLGRRRRPDRPSFEPEEENEPQMDAHRHG